ncbi:MAG: HNH endonuclease [Calditrichaeota bacterium]|nr:MAG: HNH endonuclease [Calditrichota bacterium]
MENSKSEIIKQVCDAISGDGVVKAKSILAKNYPFEAFVKSIRSYTKKQMIRVFLRDGFIDRYSGERLIFPPVLRLISNQIPKEFPYHPYWKMSECHIAYWQLSPTIDHIVPISRGGIDEESNWVCTSQLKNSAKSNWLLEELGWELYKSGNLEEWDGMLSWFIKFMEENPKDKEDNFLNSWYKTAVNTFKE